MLAIADAADYMPLRSPLFLFSVFITPDAAAFHLAIIFSPMLAISISLLMLYRCCRCWLLAVMRFHWLIWFDDYFTFRCWCLGWCLFAIFISSRFSFIIDITDALMLPLFLLLLYWCFTLTPLLLIITPFISFDAWYWFSSLSTLRRISSFLSDFSFSSLRFRHFSIDAFAACHWCRRHDADYCIAIFSLRWCHYIFAYYFHWCRFLHFFFWCWLIEFSLRYFRLSFSDSYFDDRRQFASCAFLLMLLPTFSLFIYHHWCCRCHFFLIFFFFDAPLIFSSLWCHFGHCLFIADCRLCFADMPMPMPRFSFERCCLRCHYFARFRCWFSLSLPLSPPPCCHTACYADITFFAIFAARFHCWYFIFCRYAITFIGYCFTPPDIAIDSGFHFFALRHFRFCRRLAMLFFIWCFSRFFH